jgi:hypothetical protein
MKQSNLMMLTLLAVGLFTAGVVSMQHATLSLGLIIAGVALACTVVMINEIRSAKAEIIRRMEARQQSP